MNEGRMRFLPKQVIQSRVEEMAEEISSFYLKNPGPILAVGVLKGAIHFYSDLTRELSTPVRMAFCLASSYEGKSSTGEVDISYSPSRDQVQGRDVLIVEDIVDTGRTLSVLWDHLEAMGPRSMEVCTLFRKEGVQNGPSPRWVGFEIGDRFVVGYGMDLDEEYRDVSRITFLDVE